MELFESKYIHHDIQLRLRKRLPFFQTDYKNQNKLTNILIRTVFMPLNILLKSMGLQFDEIKVKQFTFGEPSLSLKDFKTVLKIQEKSAATEIPDYVCQEARDTANMSERKYIRFRNIVNRYGGRLSSLHKSNLIKKQMNSFFTILPNALGFYVKPKQKINFVLGKIYAKLNGNILNDTFDLLISGDGLQLTRTHTNTVNFTFKVLNEKDASAIYTLGNFFNMFFGIEIAFLVLIVSN